MTSEKISKELIVEDIIEQIAIFVKVHLTEVYNLCNLFTLFKN